MADVDGTPGHSLGWHVWVGTLVTVVPATLLVALRFFARLKSRAGVKEDDWLILGALVAAWAMASIRFYQLLQTGLGYHGDTLSKTQLMNFQKSFLAVQITYFITSALTKSSILLLYRRLFGILKKFNVAISVMLGLVACYFIVCFFASIFGCHPVSFFWNMDQEGYCFNEVQFFRWNGVANLLLDVALIALPMPSVWRLQLRLKQKLALTGIFLLGGLACLASIFRLAQFQRSRQASDSTFTTVDSGMWSQVEQTVSIICACLPTLRPLMRSGGWGSTGGSRGGPSTVKPYYSTAFEMGTARGGHGRIPKSHPTDLWETEADTESVIGLALDSSTERAKTMVSHEREISDDGSPMQLPCPAMAIMTTREVHQDVESLRHAR